MKILLFGKGGQVGWELQRSLAPLGEVVALDHDSTDYCGNFGNPAGLLDTVRDVKPDIIVNAAAHTAVDKAESEPDLVRTLNATAPGLLAQEAQRLGAWLVHYSTDYVFDGSGERAWCETDTPAPLSVYGQTKFEGEQLIQAACQKHLVFRTSWVYGLHGANFMKTMLRLARERNELRVIGDQTGAPTWTRHLADITALCVDRRDCPNGLYHLTAAGETTWHAYATAIFAEAQHLGLLEKIPTVHRISTQDYPLPASRPANSRLDCSHFQNNFGLILPNWHTGLIDCLADARF